MTQKVIPCTKGDSDGYIVAQLIAKGANTDGWIQESSSALLADNHGSISGAPLNAFAESHSSSSYDVTIDTGEGFVGGAWAAKDTTTTATLNSSTTGQTVYLGWDAEGTDTILIGLTDGSTGDPGFTSEDPRIPIWTFDTDGSGVTASYDERQIGKASDLGSVTLDDDSKFGRWISNAVSSSPNGTAGNSNNEAYRVAGTSSDLVMSVQDGSGKINLAYNTYFDGSDWRYMVDNEPAYRIEYSSGIKLHTAASGTADNIVSFSTFQVDSSGSLFSNGTQVYDDTAGAIPKAQLGGPSSSLSGYPLPPGDLKTGSGSGLNADQVDGYDAADLGGEWNFVASYEDADETTVLNHTFSPTTTYDQWKVKTYWEPNPGSTEHEWLNIYVNKDRSSNYNLKWADDGEEIGESNGNSWWKRICNTDDATYGYGEYVLTSPTSDIGTGVSDHYPKIAAVMDSGTWYVDHFLHGDLKVDYPNGLSDITVASGEGNSDQYAAGRIELLGRDI